MKSNFSLPCLNLYKYVLFHGLDDHNNIGRNRDHIIILNQYLFLIFVIFIIQGLATGLLLGFKMQICVFWSTSCFTILICFFFKHVFRNKYIISLLFVYLIMIVTYYSSIIGVASGCFLYYFPLLTALPIFFSLKKDTTFVLFLLSMILICLYGSALTNFELWGSAAQSDYKIHRQQFLVLNISCHLMLLSVNYFFLEQKRNDYYNIISRNLHKREQIENLSIENNKLKELIDQKELSEESLKELLNTVSLSDVVFLEKFYQAFPYFQKRLFDYTLVQLTTSELAFCAIVKLGLSTKEIALHTGTSLKSVEGRKYRLRKKLNIPSDIDFVTWFSNY